MPRVLPIAFATISGASAAALIAAALSSSSDLKSNKGHLFERQLAGNYSEAPANAARPSQTEGNWLLASNRLEFAITRSRNSSQASPSIQDFLAVQAGVEGIPVLPSRDGELIGRGLAFGYVVNRGFHQLPTPTEIADSATYFRCTLPGLLSARQRSGDPTGIYQSVSTEWKDTLGREYETDRSFRRFCLQLSAESGELEATRAIALLPPGGKPKPQAEFIHAAVYLFEAASTLSPNTFERLLGDFEARYPEALLDVISEARIYPSFWSFYLPTVKSNVHDAIARRVSAKVMNGTPSEIQIALKLFPDPGKIPTDAAMQLTLAASLIGTAAMDDWLGKIDAKARAKILGEIQGFRFRQAYASVEGKVFSWGLRAERMLQSEYVIEDASQNVLNALIGDCRSTEALPVLESLAERYKGVSEDKGRRIRDSALTVILDTTIATQGSEALQASIQKGFDHGDDFLVMRGISILVSNDRTKAEALRDSTLNRDLAFKIDEQILASADSRASYADRFKMLTDRLDKANGTDGITPGMSQGIESFVNDGAEGNRTIAAAMIEKLPEGALREKTMKNLVNRWAELDPVAASDWIIKLPQSHSRDVAVSELVQSSYDDPEVAFANAAAIRDVDLRRKAAGAVVEKWKALNPEAIEAILSSSALLQEDKDILTANLKGNGKK